MLYSSDSVTTVILSVIFPALAAIAVACRFRARKIKLLPLQADDMTILVALSIGIGMALLDIYGSVAGGLGQPPLEQAPNESRVFFKELFAVIILNLSSLTAIKLSLLLMYKRIFITPRLCLVANITMGVVIAWFLAFFIVSPISKWVDNADVNQALFFAFRPISNFWNQLEASPSYNVGPFSLALAALDIVVDLWTLCLPLPVIKTLHIGTRRKIQLAGIFWLGLFCVVSGSVRLYYVYTFTTIASAADPAFSGIVANNIIWALIEPCTSIVAACLPTLGPILNGWRIPESIVNCIHSVLSLESAHPGPGYVGSKKPNDKADQDSSAAKRAWMELPSNSAVAERGSQDLELATLEAGGGENWKDGILVERSFATAMDEQK